MSWNGVKKFFFLVMIGLATGIQAREKPDSAFLVGKSGTIDFPALSGTESGSQLTTGVKPLPNGGMEIAQSAACPAGGLKSVGWKMRFSRGYDIIIPNGGGRILKWSVTREGFAAEGPMGWEVPLVILQGAEGGYAIWSPDRTWQFYRIAIDRTEAGWTIAVTTSAEVPYDRVDRLTAMRWRVEPYRGTWQVPARRFRDHLEKECGFVRTTRQTPAWVNDIRAMVYPADDPAMLDLLAKQCDPRQTMLYLHKWRRQSFDCGYPDYDQLATGVKAFIDHAHRLGFRVMLHTNFFSIDIHHPLYRQFENELLRKVDGSRIGWRNTRHKPVVASDYVNVASPRWRKLFIERMKRMVELTGADGIHLDQNFHLHQDYNGRIDGMNNIDGSLAFHRELKAALPEIALGGEGLNGIAARSLQFTQRHAFSVMRGTIDRQDLAKYHPISSFIFTPYVKHYAWLGIPDPIDPVRSQLFAAWYEAYRRMGIIPTLKALRLTPEMFAAPKGFLRQQLDELKFWQRERVDYAPDAVWPVGADFVFRTAAGKPVVRTQDRRLLADGREISRTVTGVREMKAPGSMDDWYLYDRERIFGLRPDRWYAYFTAPRNREAFHVEALPERFTLDELREAPGALLLKFAQDGGVWRLLCGESPAEIRVEQPDRDGRMTTRTLARNAEQGGNVTDDQNGPETSAAGFRTVGRMIVMSPPARFSHVDRETRIRQYSGSGRVAAVYRIKLPPQPCRFVTGMAMEGSALGRGKSDGATFCVEATADGKTLKAEKFFDARKLNSLWDGAERGHLALDLTPLQGRTVELTLAVAPGPFRNATRDDAVWIMPKVELGSVGGSPIELVSPVPLYGACNGDLPVPLQTSAPGRYRLQAELPGTVMLLKKAPVEVKMPFRFAGTAPAIVSCDGSDRDGRLPANVFYRSSGRDWQIHPPQRGEIVADYFLQLPASPVRFRAEAGIMTGHEKSNGVGIRFKVNGETVAETTVVPGASRIVEFELSRWAGQRIRLSVNVDANGDYADDWLRISGASLQASGQGASR